MWQGKRSSRRIGHLSILLILTLFTAAWPAPSAAAPGGTISSAVADAQWWSGRIIGVATCHDCFAQIPARLQWLPILTVQPNLPSYVCRGDEWRDSDPNTKIAWSGGSRTSDGEAPFDLTQGVLLPGVVGQRACLTIVSTVQRRNPVCVAQAPVLGMDPDDCPLEDATVEDRVAVRDFVLESAAPAPQPPSPAPQTPAPSAPVVAAPPTSSASAPARGRRASTHVLAKGTAERRARSAILKHRGSAWSKGTTRRVRCSRLTRRRFRCTARWRYRGKVRRARVLVSWSTSGRVTARLGAGQ